MIDAGPSVSEHLNSHGVQIGVGRFVVIDSALWPGYEGTSRYVVGRVIDVTRSGVRIDYSPFTDPGEGWFPVDAVVSTFLLSALFPRTDVTDLAWVEQSLLPHDPEPDETIGPNA